MGSGSGRVTYDTKIISAAGQAGWFSWEYPVFTPPNHLALFEIGEMILKGRKPKSGGLKVLYNKE